MCLQGPTTEYFECASEYGFCGKIVHRNDWKNQRMKKMSQSRIDLGPGVVGKGNPGVDLYVGFLGEWTWTCPSSK